MRIRKFAVVMTTALTTILTLTLHAREDRGKEAAEKDTAKPSSV
jgi:hypothetical protein